MNTEHVINKETQTTRIPNKLADEKSPYLLQHAYNPVNWYPWGNEAFKKAKKENKPIFLSIGYSTCHWCHVMAHESFENLKVAEILNKHFISIKVDREERPDIDTIYMNVCQTLTGSGGWPTSIFMTPWQKPFFAGTYFPPESRYGYLGLKDLLLKISKQWNQNREKLIQSADVITAHLHLTEQNKSDISWQMVKNTAFYLKQTYDQHNGGFGRAPKFPTPHNLLFLLNYYEITKDKDCLVMAETTLVQMYKGGLFDHIGFGFSRYSTDDYYLIPHFEKMLYDNALLIMAYAKAFQITRNSVYQKIAEKTAAFILREMTSQQGGFYSAQDADSEGKEGNYYLFDYDEIINVLGLNAGNEFNNFYGITKQGNFEGKNIPNLLNSNKLHKELNDSISTLYQYRKVRSELPLDDKILVSWNSLMISAFSIMYRTFGNEYYLNTAKKSLQFIENNLTENLSLSVSWRHGKSASKGFLDDYAFFIMALLSMYDATLEEPYLEKALAFYKKAEENFYDTENDGFFLSGKGHEKLLYQPKESLDGAIPSGNSVMCYNLLKLAALFSDTELENKAKRQISFMAPNAEKYPGSCSFFMTALLQYFYPPPKVICVLKDPEDKQQLRTKIGFYADILLLEFPTDEYKLQNDKTTYYVCKNHSCLPPSNNLKEIF